jgi:integrase
MDVNVMNSYWFTSRPKGAEHRHPFLVFDCQDRLHLPLTMFGKRASTQLSSQTAKSYLYALTPFFTFIDTDIWQVRAGVTWDAPSTQVRQTVEDYLVQKLKCMVQQHRHGWHYVDMTTGTSSTLRRFLAALKLFYTIMRQCGIYKFHNPMVDAMSSTIASVLAHLDDDDGENHPRMPDESGVSEPRPKPAHRLTDSYFKLEQEEWVPQIVDDPTLLAQIIKGGEKLPLRYTRQREEVITWLLFETGARISEVAGLMLGDWATLGTHTESRTFSKGSHGRRTKKISFANDTVILLKRYFDEERIRFDPSGRTLEDYLLLAKRKQIDLGTIPLFLTTQGTQLTPKEYREHYWKPACKAADPPIIVDIHQVRHWRVTLAVRDIYETAQSKEEIERRLRGIVEYMRWKDEKMLEVYQHYFDEQFNANKRDELLKNMHQNIQQYLEERRRGIRGELEPHMDKKMENVKNPNQTAMFVLDEEPEIAFLHRLGGKR